MAYTTKKMKTFFSVTEKPPHIYVDSIQLIQEIKKHPVIYNTCMPRRDMFSLFGAWECVNKTLIPLYHVMNESDKTIIRANLRKRWSWMRGILASDISSQRLNRHIELEWMQEMKFLIPFIINRRKIKEVNNPTALASQTEVIAKKLENPRELASQADVITSTTSTTPSPSAPTTVASLPTSLSQSVPISTSTQQPSPNNNNQAIHELHDVMVDTFIMSFTPNGFHSLTDPDKNFLFALLQIFRKVRPERKELLKRKFINFFPKSVKKPTEIA